MKNPKLTEAIAKCVGQSFSRPWFHLYTSTNDVLQRVSTFTGQAKVVEFYTDSEKLYETANLGGHKLRVAYPPQASRWFFDLDPQKATYINIVLDVIANQLNFTYDFVKPRTGNYGSKYRNGSFSGMIGELQQNRADFGKNQSRSLSYK